MSVSLLSDMRILEEMKKENVVIDPFTERNLGTNSYDVRLGEFVFSPKEQFSGTLDPFNEKSVNEFWSLNHYDTGETLTIPPGTTVICHTIEVIGGRNCVTAELRARSSIARCGLSMTKGAGIGDVGYCNRWTFSLTNLNRNPTKARVGMRIGQVLFYFVGKTMKPYTGKYVQRPEWRPQMMLPRLWEDREFTEPQKRGPS